MTVTITICTDNAAFEDAFMPELHRVLHQAEERARELIPPNTAKLQDSNGNTVGTITVTE